jgi:hypothetical protein
MMRVRQTIVLILAMCCAPFALSGCASIEVLHESAYCPGGKERQAVLVRDQTALNRLWQGMQTTPQAGAVPTADFRHKSVLFLADAEKPTAGYGMWLASPDLTIDSGTATLRIETKAPRGMAAQVMTRPCLFLALPTGDFQRVEARDQTGQIWAATERSE